MPDDNELAKFLASYWGFALAVAGSSYVGIVWFGKHHLSQDFKDSLTLWLWGEYDSTWSHHFCNMFDAVFGSRHLSWRCFWRSSVASVLAVLLLYVLFAEILGVMADRALGNLSLWQAVLFGAAINILPDYLSLFETRWLLRRFERVQSVVGQLGVLVADAAFTGAIIWLAINAFQWLRGDAALSAVEMLALFSVFSLFFYSTFLTSLWAWVFCLSTWLMRLFCRTPLKNILDVEKKPVAQVALVGSALILVAVLVLTPGLKTDEQRQATAFDEWLCSMFGGKICLHVLRFTENESQAFRSLSQVCEGNELGACYEATVSFFGGDETKALPLWSKACDGGYVQGCSTVGWMYQGGGGVAPDDAKAVSHYRQACDGGDARGCGNLGWMYMSGRSVAQDDTKAVSLYRQACDGGDAPGCVNLGWMYSEGRGVAQDDTKAVPLNRQACDRGYAPGCINLGWMYSEGRGVVQDDAEAVSLYRQACDGGDAVGCNNLGWKYVNGRGVAQDDAKAESLFRQACEMGFESACTP